MKRNPPTTFPAGSIVHINVTMVARTRRGAYSVDKLTNVVDAPPRPSPVKNRNATETARKSSTAG